MWKMSSSLKYSRKGHKLILRRTSKLKLQWRMEQGAGCYEVTTGKESTTMRSHWYGEWWVVHLLSNLGCPLTDEYMCKTKFLSLPLTMWIFFYMEDHFLERLFGFCGAFLYAIWSRWSLPVVYAGWVEPVFSNCHQSTFNTLISKFYGQG